MSKQNKKEYGIELLADGILKSNRMLLSKSITYIESKLLSDRKIAREIIEKSLPYSGNSLRIGISGVPGAGKSTFIEALGKYLIEEKAKKVAVLAVDPSSNRSKGSILGDKTRMSSLAVNENAYIRPSPTSGFLGGVAATTKESIVLLEAAGFDIILIETVGVGQSETEVSEMVDFFLLLMLTGAGDNLQGIKRGIMEMADAIIINKVENRHSIEVKLARKEIQSAIQLLPAKETGWKTKVASCSALKMWNIDIVWQIVEDYIELSKKTNYFEKNRRQQDISWFQRSNQRMMNSFFRSNPEFQKKEEELLQKLKNGKVSPFVASERLFKNFQLSYLK